MSGGALLLVLGAVVASPIGRALDKGLTAHFIALNQRRADGGLSGFDVVECRLLYTALALGGMWVYPEGGKVLLTYIRGNGQDLWLDSGYIQRSPVIRRSLALLREGESRRFTFIQSADKRLSYAVNPFNIRKKNGKVLLWQKIVFDAKPHTYTTLDYGMGSFRLPDALIYSMHPRTYTVYCQWRSPNQ